MIGSVPYDGIKFVRIHYLLDLLHYTSASEVDCSSSSFTCYDSVRAHTTKTCQLP